MLGAAHKPGAMPLRPLGLGDMYDAAFRIIRFNPKATVGSAVLVATVAWLVPVIVTALLSFTLDLSLDATDTASATRTSSGLAGSIGSLAIGLLLVAFGTILVTGMIAHVTAAAAVGRRLTLGEAWAATRGKRWRLIGLALLLGLGTLVLIGAYVLLWVARRGRLGRQRAARGALGPGQRPGVHLPDGVVLGPHLLPAGARADARAGRRLRRARPRLHADPQAVLADLRHRAADPRRGQVASTFLGFPVGIIGQLASVAVGSRYSLLVLVVTQALGQVIAAAFVTPFTSAVTSLQYLDQRMRKEAYDVELMQQAGITAS